MPNANIRVLVVDANEHIRRLVATLLGALGITRIVEARTPAQAAALLTQAGVDLVIVDWVADPTEVILFTHRLRRGELGCERTPVLAMAATTHHAVLERAWEAGIDDVVAKPLSAIEIIQHSASLIEERRRAIADRNPAVAAQ
ncbi:MAG: response regulator [Magnetospirillum sp.]|nr:response regulator [Magnetospirillum sp.]